MDAQATARKGLESIVPLTRETVVVVIATEIGASSFPPATEKVGVAAGPAPERERARSPAPELPKMATGGWDSTRRLPAPPRRSGRRSARRLPSGRRSGGTTARRAPFRSFSVTSVLLPASPDSTGGWA